MKPKLYIVDPSRHITGAFKAAQNEAKVLSDIYDVILVLPTISTIEENELQPFSKVIYLPLYDLRKSFKALLVYFPALFYSGWRLRSHLREDNCDLLQINDYYLMQGVVVRLFGFKGKIVTWVRIDHRRYGSFFSKYWLKLDYSASDVVVAVSNFILNTLPNSDKNILIYDPVIDCASRSDKSQKSDKKKIVYVGNYTEGKGQEHAISAFAKIAERFPDAELHFYGGDLGLEKNRRFKEKLEKQAQETPFFDRIYFHSFVKDIGSVLQGAYMALNFSESESFSMTCLEASAAGISVIATKSGGPEEIVADHKTGLLVERGDIDAMADAMSILLSDTTKNRDYGQAGLLHMQKVFSPAKFRQKILSLFNGEVR